MENVSRTIDINQFHVVETDTPRAQELWQLMSAVLGIKPAEISLVEDSPADIRMTQEAFKDYRVANNIHIVTDSETAMNYLRCTSRFMLDLFSGWICKKR